MITVQNFILNKWVFVRFWNRCLGITAIFLIYFKFTYFQRLKHNLGKLKKNEILILKYFAVSEGFFYYYCETVCKTNGAKLIYVYMLAKLMSIMDNTTCLLHETMKTLSSSFSSRLLQQWYIIFTPTALYVYIKKKNIGVSYCI